MAANDGYKRTSIARWCSAAVPNNATQGFWKESDNIVMMQTSVYHKKKDNSETYSSITINHTPDAMQRNQNVDLCVLHQEKEAIRRDRSIPPP